MSYETRDNTGKLFRNEKKTEPNHADYEGSAVIDGQEFWMNAWLKTSDKGTKWMSFSFKPKQKQASAPPPARQAPSRAPARPSNDMDDEPF